MSPHRDPQEPRTRAERTLRRLLEPSAAASRRLVHASLSAPKRSRLRGTTLRGTTLRGTAPGLTAAVLALLLVALAFLWPQRESGPPRDSDPSSEPVPTVRVLGTGSTIVISPSPQSLRAPEPADAAGEASGSLLLIRRRNS